MTLVLAFESSCDETAVALVRRDAAGRGHVLASEIASQIKVHARYGGVVPEVAARAHLTAVEPLLDAALATSGCSLDDVDFIASTTGPGLIGGVLVGAVYGKALAHGLGKPWMGINHLEGHALTARLTDGVAFPYLLLLVSGGHTQLIFVEGVGQYKRLGTTLDDAAGECFDKSAKMMGLGYPGGPALDKAAQAGDALRFALPQPLQGKAGCDFSFSGLKTAVRQRVDAQKALTPDGTLSDAVIADLSASLQRMIAKSLAQRTAQAFDLLTAAGKQPTALVIAGGVAANSGVRRAMTDLAATHGIPCLAPPLDLCGDNAAMIGWAALERHALGLGMVGSGAPRPRWPLDPTAQGGR